MKPHFRHFYYANLSAETVSYLAEIQGDPMCQQHIGKEFGVTDSETALVGARLLVLLRGI